MITCKDCRLPKEPVEFYRDRTLKNGFSRRCKECERDRSRKKAGRMAKERLELMRRGKAKPCTDCGIQFPYYVMQFDHLPGTEKLFALSDSDNHGFVAIMDEMAKCEVVCTNCHLMRTYKRSHPEEE